MTRRPIHDIDDLRNLAKDGCECYIALDYGLRSSKYIQWFEDRKLFRVYNEIDDTEQELTEQQLFDEELTHVGKALKVGHLIKYEW